MLNPFREINWSPNTAERRQFARSWIIGFPIVASLLFLILTWRTGNGKPALCLTIGTTGAALGALLLALPQIALPFYRTWFFVGACLGTVVGNLTLSLAFFTVLTLTGILRRTLGTPPIQKRFNAASPSYWRPVRPVPDKNRYFKQF